MLVELNEPKTAEEAVRRAIDVRRRLMGGAPKRVNVITEIRSRPRQYLPVEPTRAERQKLEAEAFLADRRAEAREAFALRRANAARKASAREDALRRSVLDQLDRVRFTDPVIHPSDVALITQSVHGVTLAELSSPNRARSLVDKRHAAMWVARRLTDWSFPQIGDFFGGRDHTTVIHAVHRVDEAIERGLEVGMLALNLLQAVKDAFGSSIEEGNS